VAKISISRTLELLDWLNVSTLTLVFGHRDLEGFWSSKGIHWWVAFVFFFSLALLASACLPSVPRVLRCAGVPACPSGFGFSRR
jgi:hypothetical protein